MEENQTSEKIREFKKELEELYNQHPNETTDVDILLEYWDTEDTLINQIKKLSAALDNGIDIVSPDGWDNYLNDTFGVSEKETERKEKDEEKH